MASSFRSTKVQRQVGERLSAARQNKGLTQEAMAARLGLERAYIGWIEQGRRAPSLRTLQRMAKTSGISLEDLFRGL